MEVNSNEYKNSSRVVPAYFGFSITLTALRKNARVDIPLTLFREKNQHESLLNSSAAGFISDGRVLFQELLLSCRLRQFSPSFEFSW
jgi:hypothetical protein